MENNSVIKWCSFDEETLPDNWQEMLLLMRMGSTPKCGLTIVTDCWTGSNLMVYPENRVVMFCPYDEIRMPDIEVKHDS